MITKKLVSWNARRILRGQWVQTVGITEDISDTGIPCVLHCKNGRGFGRIGKVFLLPNSERQQLINQQYAAGRWTHDPIGGIWLDTDLDGFHSVGKSDGGFWRNGNKRRGLLRIEIEERRKRVVMTRRRGASKV